LYITVCVFTLSKSENTFASIAENLTSGHNNRQTRLYLSREIYHQVTVYRQTIDTLGSIAGSLASGHSLLRNIHACTSL